MKWTYLAALSLLVGCAESEDEEGGSVADARCATGLRWAGGDEESPSMHPGSDCIQCHTQRGEGPHFTVAGTVQATIDDPTDCYGVGGVDVTITDANAQIVDLVTNSAGNFYTNTALVMPIQIKLAFEGRERVMAMMPSVGACASCHTETGRNNAPGRILAP